MLSGMYAAISGMNANGTALSVVGDNIANLNTVGFKSSSINFADILSSSIGSAGQIGRGVSINEVAPQLSQGAFESTQSALDMAVDGNGFFMVGDSAGARYYTRAGTFHLDTLGNIINPDGYILQGYLADAAGNITGAVGDMQIATTQSPANATTNVEVAINLDANEAVPAAAFTLDGNGDGTNNDPANYNFSSSTVVYDSQGGSHQVTLYFVKTGVNTWDVHNVYEDTAAPGTLIDAGTQALTFNTDGSLNTDNSAAAINFNFGAAVVTPQPITFNYGTGTGEVPAGTGFEASTQFKSDFATLSVTQDGYTSGSLRSINIADSGVITGVFTNGQTRAIGQIALARFAAPTELDKLGKNLYGATFDSGTPIVGMAGTSGLGRVLSNSLEMSNVDLAEQFVKMIAYQRGFQANTRVITTSDELMQEIVNIKR